jgi:hypothetical protein
VSKDDQEGSGEGDQEPSSIAAMIASGVKASGILAACGYISLRGHFNRLGLSMGGVDAERYAMETWNFLHVMVQRYALVVGTLALAYVGSRAAAVKWESVRRVRRGAAGRQRRPPGLAAPLVVMAGALCTYAIYRNGISLIRPDMAVGLLDPAVLAGARPSAHTMDLLVLPCVAAFAFMSGWRRGEGAASERDESEPSGPVAWAHQAARWMWWVVALHAPLAYGLALHGSSYPACRLVPKGGDERAPEGAGCGLLIAQSKEWVTIWRARRGHAETLIVPADEARLVVYRLHDLLTEAEIAAREPKGDAPDCN